MSEKSIGEAIWDGGCLREARQNVARLKAAIEELREDLQSARQALEVVTSDRNAIAEDRDAWRLLADTRAVKIAEARVLAAAILKMTEGAGDE